MYVLSDRHLAQKRSYIYEYEADADFEDVKSGSFKDNAGNIVRAFVEFAGEEPEVMIDSTI